MMTLLFGSQYQRLAKDQQIQMVSQHLPQARKPASNLHELQGAPKEQKDPRTRSPNNKQIWVAAPKI